MAVGASLPAVTASSSTPVFRYRRSNSTASGARKHAVYRAETGKMTTLPKLTPQSTPMRTTSWSLSSMYEVYPPHLPKEMEMPKRINVLRPSKSSQRTVSLETERPNFDNIQRSEWMKQRDHYRYHNAWSKYYYGSPAEKEAYRSYNRNILKQQMADKQSAERKHMVEKVRESEDAVSRDIHDRIEDAVDFQRRFEHLKTFRDENKKLMETNWDLNRRRKQHQDLFDREQLKYNPINWTGSLK